MKAVYTRISFLVYILQDESTKASTHHAQPHLDALLVALWRVDDGGRRADINQPSWRKGDFDNFHERAVLQSVDGTEREPYKKKKREKEKPRNSNYAHKYLIVAMAQSSRSRTKTQTTSTENKGSFLQFPWWW